MPVHGMRKLTLLALLACPLLGSPAPAPETPPGPGAGEIGTLRQRLEQAATREQWEVVARQLLAALDRKALGQSHEAIWLVSQLLEAYPEDPVLVWRRAEAARRSGETQAAIADFEHLADKHPDHVLGIRASRALPAMYLLAGEREKAARADEALLGRGIADPVAVLSRLARTYELLGDQEKLRSALARLRRHAPDKVRLDPELAWLDADTIASAKTPREAAKAMLRFANLFPRDARRGEALMRAAESFRAQGNETLALRLVGQALEETRDPEKAVEVRLVKGEVLEDLGQTVEARREYEAIIDGALDPLPAAKALRRLADMEEARYGTAEAALMAASLVRNGDPFIREMARNHYDRLVRKIWPELVKDPAQAAFFQRLSEEIGQPGALSGEARMAAARLREMIGSYDRAGRIYSTVARGIGRQAELARRGVARTLPRKPVKGIAMNDPIRLEALAREQAWPAILEILRGSHPSGKDEALQRTYGARAAFAEHQPVKASQWLEPIASPSGKAALLRGDGRAVAGDWKGACQDYLRAGPSIREQVARQWLQVRLAACEVRAGKPAAARRRLGKLLSEEPGIPARVAAQDLMARLGTKQETDAREPPS